MRRGASRGPKSVVANRDFGLAHPAGKCEKTSAASCRLILRWQRRHRWFETNCVRGLCFEMVEEDLEKQLQRTEKKSYFQKAAGGRSVWPPIHDPSAFAGED